MLAEENRMRIIQIIIGVLLSAIAIAATFWALFSTSFPYKHPLMATGLCLYGCIIAPVFILLGESLIEDGVKLVMMFVIAAVLWKIQSWQIAVPFSVSPICGMLANQIIKTMNQKIKRNQQSNGALPRRNA